MAPGLRRYRGPGALLAAGLTPEPPVRGTRGAGGGGGGVPEPSELKKLFVSSAPARPAASPAVSWGDGLLIELIASRAARRCR